jgi:hypothetical protein
MKTRKKVTKKQAQEYIEKFGIKKAYTDNTSLKQFIVLKASSLQCGIAISKKSEVEADAHNEDGDAETKRPVFRMLSNTTVQEVYDFTEVSLEKHIDLFSHTKLMKDHTHTIDSIIGTVGVASFDEARGNEDDKDFIPSGVNAELIIDEEFGATEKKKVAKGLIDSGSVGINFESVPSHEFEDPWDFYWLLGTEVDGELVRFVVTDILEIKEFSLVWLGADPFAKDQSTQASNDSVFEFKKQLDKSTDELSTVSLELKESKSKLELADEKIRVFEENSQIILSLVNDFTEASKMIKLGKQFISELKQDVKDTFIKANMKSDEEMNIINDTTDIAQLKLYLTMAKSKVGELPNGQLSVGRTSNGTGSMLTLNSSGDTINLKPIAKE